MHRITSEERHKRNRGILLYHIWKRCRDVRIIDLNSLAIAAGYKLRAKNMTAMGVLKVYALGDIKFGFCTYTVLAGILIRDLFPDPEILCKLLECSQKTAVE